MRQNRGFTLLEALLAAFLGTLLLSAFLVALAQFQKGSLNLQVLLEREENVRLATVLLAQWTKPGGNNRWGKEWQGIAASPERLDVASDIDGQAGFPDGELAQPFEMMAFRLSGSSLQARNNSGTFQPIVKNLQGLFFTRPRDDTLTIGLESLTDISIFLEDGQRRHRTDLKEYLWNYRPNLFAEEVQ